MPKMMLMDDITKQEKEEEVRTTIIFLKLPRGVFSGGQPLFIKWLSIIKGEFRGCTDTIF